MDLHVLGYLSAELGKAKVDGIKKKFRTELFPERHKRALKSQDTCRCQCDRDTYLGPGLATSSQSSTVRWGNTSACRNSTGLFQAGKRMLSSSPCSLEFQGLLQIPEHRGYVNTNYISMPSNFVSSFLLKHLVLSVVGISMQPPSRHC